MKLVVFGLSVSSSWGNGHATTYRALLSALHRRGHEIVFFEWDAPWYAAYRDLPAPDFCRLVLYSRWEEVRRLALGEASEADAVLVGSFVRDGVRVVDDLHDAGVGDLSFYDIDTPVTVSQLRRGECEFLRREQVPLFRRYLSFTGGPFLERVVEGELGARATRPLYCSVDVERYRPTAADARFRADLAYLGTYAPDRQPSLERLLLEPARGMPRRRFLVAGPKYPGRGSWPSSVRHVEHVAPPDHPAFYGSADWQLNLTRREMRAAGFSPSVRLFEAAACGCAILSDRWPGIEAFFEPGREILLPEDGEDVLGILEDTRADDRRALARAARERVLREHSSDRRALELERLLQAGDSLFGAARRTSASPPPGPSPR